MSLLTRLAKFTPSKMEWQWRAWFDGLKSPHPNLTLCTAQPLSHCRAAAGNKENIEELSAKLGAICARLNLLSKPMQIYNVNETRISIVHKPGKVVTEVSRAKECLVGNLCRER